MASLLWLTIGIALIAIVLPYLPPGAAIWARKFGVFDAPVPDLGPIPFKNSSSGIATDWSHGVFMEIYVRGYKDSDGDGIGDLQGLISKLDYLQELGITGLWLLPVTQSSDRDHGYAVMNYRAIEQDYGTLEDFSILLLEAHKRGIGVIIDYVINHSSDQHPLFKNSGSSPSDAFRTFHIWEPGAGPSGWWIFNQNPWYQTATGAYFAVFWSGMPDFNLRNEQSIQFHHDNLRYWLNQQVDGVRFDAVSHLVENGKDAWLNQPENFVIMSDIRDLVASYPNRFMVCESPGASRQFAASCGSAFDFPLAGMVRAAMQGLGSSVPALSDHLASSHNMSTMLSNHDSFAGPRLWDQVGGDTRRYRLAAATYLLAPGVPFVYYGEEVGMNGGEGLSGDAALRSPMSWDADGRGFTDAAQPFRALAANRAQQNVAAEAGDPESLLEYYRSLIRLRTAVAALAIGEYVPAGPQPVPPDGRVLAFERRAGVGRAVVVINYGEGDAALRLTGLPPGATLAPRLGGGGEVVVGPDGAATMEGLVGLSAHVFVMQ